MRPITLVLVGVSVLWAMGCAVTLGNTDPCLGEVGISCEEFRRRLERYSRRELYWAMPEAEFRALHLQSPRPESDRPRLLRQTDDQYEFGWGGRSAAFRVTFEQGALVNYEERWIDKIVWVYDSSLSELKIARPVLLQCKVASGDIQDILIAIDAIMTNRLPLWENGWHYNESRRYYLQVYDNDVQLPAAELHFSVKWEDGSTTLVRIDPDLADWSQVWLVKPSMGKGGHLNVQFCKAVQNRFYQTTDQIVGRLGQSFGPDHLHRLQ